MELKGQLRKLEQCPMKTDFPGSAGGDVEPELPGLPVHHGMRDCRANSLFAVMELRYLGSICSLHSLLFLCQGSLAEPRSRRRRSSALRINNNQAPLIQEQLQAQVQPGLSRPESGHQSATSVPTVLAGSPA